MINILCNNNQCGQLFSILLIHLLKLNTFNFNLMICELYGIMFKKLKFQFFFYNLNSCRSVKKLLKYLKSMLGC